MIGANKRYKLTVAYDGTDYQGWQVQPHGRTIADVLQVAFFRAFKQSIVLAGASRTDAGVHALGQVAAFSTHLTLTAEHLRRIWNNRLPSSIVVTSLQEVEDSFNPRSNVKQKTYHYHFFDKHPLPFNARYSYFVKNKMNHALLYEALQLFVGEHDFRSFCSGWEVENTIRTIDSIELGYNKEWKAYQIEVKGKSFLRYMIRRIVGASFQVAMGYKPLALIQQALQECDPEQELFNAPAHGLLLYDIAYKGDLNEKK